MIHTLLQASSDLTLKETIKLENGLDLSVVLKKRPSDDTFLFVRNDIENNFKYFKKRTIENH